MPVLHTRCYKRSRPLFALFRMIVLMAGMLLSVGNLSAGNTRAKEFYRASHVVSAHLFGDASLISLQYEQVFAHRDMSFFTAGAGFGYQEEFFLNNIFTKDPPDKYRSIPHHVSFNYGGSNKFLELGIGGTLMSGNTSQNYFVYPLIGLRFHPEEYAGLCGRIYLEWPLYPAYEKIYSILFVPFGLSLGYAF